MTRHRLRTSALVRLAALPAAAALLLAACTGSAAAPTTAPSAAAAASGTVYTVTVAQDAKLGAHLAGVDGRSLYQLTADSNNTPTCTGACANTWPSFELQGSDTVVAGTGVTGALATVKRADDGKMQVTYNGVPLYYYAADAKAGDIGGQGYKGVWFLAGPASSATGGPITGGVGQAAPAASYGY